MMEPADRWRAYLLDVSTFTAPTGRRLPKQVPKFGINTLEHPQMLSLSVGCRRFAPLG
jgi:hypothetical protein